MQQEVGSPWQGSLSLTVSQSTRRSYSNSEIYPQADCFLPSFLFTLCPHSPSFLTRITVFSSRVSLLLPLWSSWPSNKKASSFQNLSSPFYLCNQALAVAHKALQDGISQRPPRRPRRFLSLALLPIPAPGPCRHLPAICSWQALGPDHSLCLERAALIPFKATQVSRLRGATPPIQTYVSPPVLPIHFTKLNFFP